MACRCVDAVRVLDERARGYRRWNSFTTSVRGRIDEGERVFLNVTLDYPFVGKIANEYPFLVTEMTSSGSSRNASAILCWSAQLVPEALQRHILNTRRCMRLKRDRDGIVRFMQWDTNRGFLSQRSDFCSVERSSRVFVPMHTICM